MGKRERERVRGSDDSLPVSGGLTRLFRCRTVVNICLRFLHLNCTAPLKAFKWLHQYREATTSCLASNISSPFSLYLSRNKAAASSELTCPLLLVDNSGRLLPSINQWWVMQPFRVGTNGKRAQVLGIVDCENLSLTNTHYFFSSAVPSPFLIRHHSLLLCLVFSL